MKNEDPMIKPSPELISITIDIIKRSFPKDPEVISIDNLGNEEEIGKLFNNFNILLFLLAFLPEKDFTSSPKIVHEAIKLHLDAIEFTDSLRFKYNYKQGAVPENLTRQIINKLPAEEQPQFKTMLKNIEHKSQKITKFIKISPTIH